MSNLKLLQNSNFYVSNDSKDIHYQCIKREIFDLLVYDLPFCPLPSRGVVFDLGANIGMFAHYAITRKNNYVYCFEPAANCVPALYKNLESYNKRYRIIEKGVWSESGTLEFVEYGDFSGCNHLEPANTIRDPDVSIYKVDVISIDEFVANERLGQVDFMKFDVEGAEMEVLMGAKDTIQKFKPRMVVSAYHKANDEENLVNYIKSIQDYKVTIVNHTDIEIKLAYCY